MNFPVEPTKQPVWKLSTYAFAVLRGQSAEHISYDEALSGYDAAGSHYTNSNLGIEPWVYDAPRSEWYKRPLLGMQELPLALHRNYLDTYRGRTLMNQELRRVERTADPHYPYLLTLEETKTSPCTGITKGTGKLTTMRAGRVILALPKAALLSVDFVDSLPSKGQDLHSQVASLTDATTGTPLMKLLAAFRERWWQRVGAGGAHDFNVGDFISSTPVNSLYAWYPGTQARDADGSLADVPAQCKRTSGDDMGVLHMYVTDAVERSWAGFAAEGEQADCNVTDATRCSDCFSNATGFFVTDTNPATNHVAQGLVDEWRAQLAVTFGVALSDIPEPTELKYTIWSGDNPQTRSDAIHRWNAGVRWWKLYDQALEVGGQGSRLHIVGETFSLHYGWGEGALETAEYMLHEHLGLPLPGWLSMHEYCMAMPFYPFNRTA